MTVLMIGALISTSNARTYKLSLEQSIELAREKSLRMQRLIMDMEIAEANLKSTISNYRLQMDLELRPDYNDQVMEWSDSTGISYYSHKALNLFGGVTVRQPLPSNGSIFISTGLENNINYYNHRRSSSFNTRVGINQPLDAFWGYNNHTASIKRARLAYELSTKSLTRAELDLIYNITSSFYNLLSIQKNVEIAYLDLERQKEASEMTQKKFEAGLMREVDALQMEVELAQAHNSYEIQLLSMESATNSFKEILGVELDDEVLLESDLDYSTVYVDPDKAVEYALENRLEIRENEIQIEQGKLDLKRQKAEGLPTAALNGYFEKKGVSREPFSTDYGRMVRRSFSDYGSRPINYAIGMTIRIPIIDWGKNKHSVKAAETSLKQSVIRKEEAERSIEIEVRNLAARINSNLKMLQLLERNVEVAEKSFQITLGRYSEGDIDSDALANERARLNGAYTSHLNAYITYKLSLADIMRQTFYDFENNRSIEHRNIDMY